MRVFLSLLLLAVACDGGGLPEVWAPTPEGDGPRILWNINAEPLPELPLPNDIATWPDRTSPTGRRINVSLVAPTGFERDTRELFDRLDGWGTYGGITVPFDEHLDLQNIMRRQGGTSEAFRTERFPDHAIYLINMTTGLPVPLDINHGNFPLVLDNTANYFNNDPRASESNLLLETVDEDVNGNGVMDPGEDTDFDGVLDQPNTFDGEEGGVDDMVLFYERQTKTLLLKPILPMRPRTTYAVVLTDRLVGENGHSIRSPFDGVHHIAQYDALAALPAHFSAHSELYGDLGERGWDGVAFAWTFTTQSTTTELDTIRDGLYGEGTMARLQDEFPNDYAPSPMQDQSARCTTPDAEVIIAPGEKFVRLFRTLLLLAFGVDEDVADGILDTFNALDHVAIINFDSPYFLGDPATVRTEGVFEMDAATGEARVNRETLSMMIFVPKETEQHQQPFDTAFYVHGYGSNSAEALPFTGYMMQQGMAMVVLNAEGHGAPLEPGLIGLIRPLFGNGDVCLSSAFDAIVAGRAEDHNGDGIVDSGADFWTAYLFHTRDVVRQSIVDHMRAIQLLRSFDGRTAEPVFFPDSPVSAITAGDGPNLGIDYDANIFGMGGDIAGDFDGDGVPDVGGPANRVLFTGGSLGGFVSGIMAGVEPLLSASAPIVGAGGLTDVAARSDNGGVKNAMHLRMMGPYVVVDPVVAIDDGMSPGPRQTSCAVGERTMYFLATERNTQARLEFACLSAEVTGPDDVIVVGNLVNDEIRCGGAVGGESGRFQIPFPADAGDPIYVEIHPGRANDVDYGTCTFEGGKHDDRIVVSTFEVGAEDCPECARYQTTEWQRGEGLVSPAEGFGRRRQSPDLRRLLYLAQIGLEPADPINYARRVFLEPVGQPINLLVANSIGDHNVPLSGGNAYARATGLLPFLPPDAPEHLRDWRAPASFEEDYPGYTNPNDLLIAMGVFEGVDRLERHPQDDGPDDFLMDVDDLSNGAYRFDPNGRHQSNEPDAVMSYPRLSRPLRWVRQSRPMESSDDDVWNPIPGEDISGLINHYAVPAGVHGFDEIFYDQELSWDPAQYLINLITRYGVTGGQDIRYYTDPEGHTCLENSSCSFFSTPRGSLD